MSKGFAVPVKVRSNCFTPLKINMSSLRRQLGLEMLGLLRMFVIVCGMLQGVAAGVPADTQVTVYWIPKEVRGIYSRNAIRETRGRDCSVRYSIRCLGHYSGGYSGAVQSSTPAMEASGTHPRLRKYQTKHQTLEELIRHGQMLHSCCLVRFI